MNLVRKLESAMKKQKDEKLKKINLEFSKEEIEYIYIWVKTGYANDKTLNKLLGL